MSILVSTDRAWMKGSLVEGQCVEIINGVIGHLGPIGAATPDVKASLVGPALADLQVNGSGGTMLNSDPSATGIERIVGSQRSLGVGWIMPTLITCDQATMVSAVEAAVAVWGIDGFLGLHIEGPHISEVKRGTHKAEFVRPLDTCTMNALGKLRGHNIPVLLTLAPEVVDPESIRKIVSLGVTVSLGHSMASAETVSEALAAGATCFTHLYNAMPPMTSREPGIVGTAICSNAYAGFIADGKHVSWDMLRIAMRARPSADLMFMVSDAMATVGGPDSFELYGETIQVQDGVLVNREGALAGAHINLLSSLKNGVRHLGLTVEEAYLMCAMVPWDVLRLQRPTLVAGMSIDEVIMLDADLQRITI